MRISAIFYLSWAIFYASKIPVLWRKRQKNLSQFTPTFQGMTDSHVVSGLKAKQHEIRRRISELEDEIKVCRADLVSISEALRICGDPEAYARPEAMFGRGDLARTIFDALRKAPDGLETAGLAEIVAKANDLDVSDPQAAHIIHKRVYSALYRYFGRREVISRIGPQGTRIWRIAP